MASSNDKDGEGRQSQDHWYLVDTHGQKFRLPKTMLFLGREECDVIVASQSVDKRHAVLTFDLYLNQFKVKDLSTTNGTFVNNSRIPEEEYITLNHMDSIRLGQDAMMYHIEQASQIQVYREQLPEPHYIPSWANQKPATIRTHMQAAALSEYQGCMGDQTIEHACCMKLDHKAGESGIQMACTAHRKQLHQEQHIQRYGLPKETSMEIVPEGSVTPSSECFGQKNHIPLQPVIQEQKNGSCHVRPTEIKDQNSLTDHLGDSKYVDHTACPKPQETKQMTQTDLHVTPEVCEKPGKSASEAHPGGVVQTMFVVTFDDSVCNTDIGTTSLHQQRPAGTSRNHQSSELGTVKQGTPLYGQPSWWGEGEGEGDPTATNSSTSEGENRSGNGNARPTDLGLKGHEVAGTFKPKSLSRLSSFESEHGKSYLNPTYMEIPLIENGSPKGTDKSKDIATPAKSVTSSLSRDSLSLSPELKQPMKTAKMYSSPNLEGSSAMSFTIDLDDPERPPKKSLNIGSSISEFVPSKIRKNFRERKAVSSKTGSKESTPSKHSEERELSPLGHQKVEDIPSLPAEGRGRPWLASLQVTAGSSLRSPNLEEIDRFSDFSDDRSSQERDTRKRSSVKRAASSKHAQVSSKTVSSPSVKSGSRSPSGAANNLSMSHYSDPTCYLIDRMLEGGSADPLRADKQQSPETRMYREAAIYDKTVTARPSTDRSLVRPVIDAGPYLAAAATKLVKKTALSKPAQPAPLVEAPGSELDDRDDDLQITEDTADSDVEAAEKDDNISDAGTYTIEAELKEEKEKEEQEARKRIDQVFGVDLDSFSTDQPVIDPLRLASPGGYDNLYDISADGERTPLDENNLSPVEGDDTDLTVDDDYVDENSDMAATDGVQMWVSQLAALTNQKSLESNRMAQQDSDGSLSKKPPQGISRKRPGTGRKLPTIPGDKSPVGSEHGSVNADLDNDLSLRRTPDRVASGRNSADSNHNMGTHSSQSHTRTVSNGHPASPSSLARTGSVDTQVLLQDTETVMAAIQARLSHKTSHGRKNSYSRDCDSDASSTVVLVNGQENYVKSAPYKSPREALAQIQRNGVAVKSVNTPSTTPESSGKKPVIRSSAQSIASRTTASPRSTPSTSATRKSVVSDIVSRRDSMDNDSIMSDVSSDAGDAFARSSSKGKAPITMTRTNKTFDLRRARVDSFEEQTAPRSAKSSSSTKSGVGNSFGRSQSLHSTTRSRSLVNTGRSEATSLGAQIVKKSQNNIAQETLRKAGNASVGRTENGRHNQAKKLQHSSCATAPHPSAGHSQAKRESTPKSQSRLTPTNKANLVIAGTSSASSRSQSQPGSRSNSPKAAEKMAWKRRKEYDARKSVADAKAGKTKDGVDTKSKSSANSDIKKRMIRSASFTNSAGLSLAVRNSASDSQEFSDQMDAYSKHEDFRRAFIPFQSSLRSDRYTHSADEDDSQVSTNSTQDVARSLVSLLETPSAFTPPPHRHRPVSPDISPPSKAYLSLRRRTLNIEGSFLTRELQTNGLTKEGRRYTTDSQYQASYDSLIVASIYQLSLKLKTSTDKTLSMLRDQNRVSLTPSPIDDFLSDSGKSEITAWKTANQELASTLKNLRKLERHVYLMNAVIFPDMDVTSELSSHVPTSRQVKQKLLEDIEKKFGFQPIDHPDLEESDFASPEMAEFSGHF